ncbi:Rieske (2Fe-2S) protein [Actinomadura sp. 9N407]|uniref:Rieske (2Fe-2S) protein n=1 Tax=Actinomadura sp. 9N407 TaxID=3375154 RepID=UPI0037933649
MAQAPAPRTDSSEAPPAAEPATAGTPVAGTRVAGTPAAGTPDGNTRRGVLIGAGLAGVAGLAAACGGDEGGGGTSGDPSGGEGGQGGSAAGLAKTADIPVGGGKIIEGEKIVIVQPVQGQFKAYSTKCTHRGCPVDSVSGGTINCPCHGSKFKIADGSVATPPATEPLAEKQIKVEGDQITLA